MLGQTSLVGAGAIGRYGSKFDSLNDNGELLLQLCAKAGLVVCNTLFRKDERLKGTWMHPRSKRWHVLDYILVRRRDRQEVMDTTVLDKAQCHTDHRLLAAVLRMKVRPLVRNHEAKRKPRPNAAS